MSFLALSPRHARVLWLEPHRIAVNGTTKPLEGLPTEDQLAQALVTLPTGPTKWIVDDLYAPAVILRDIAEVPPAGDGREQFFRWKYSQAISAEDAQSVQALNIGDGAWLASGVPTELRDAWIGLSTRLSRPINALVPRWLWLYNRLAPTLELPGILLSLCPHMDGGFTGTLAAWNRQLTLLRQWSDPADIDGWMTERVQPTASYLARDGRRPHDLWVWGAPSWPTGDLAAKIIQPVIPTQEAL